MKELTKEELKKDMYELQEKIQNDFIDKLLDMVEHYESKVIKTSYKASIKEHQKFTKIKNIIDSIDKYI